jgi:peptidoglycan/xylan/chitin deacetylase (PgdA/CDA1 family)
VNRRAFLLGAAALTACGSTTSRAAVTTLLPTTTDADSGALRTTTEPSTVPTLAPQSTTTEPAAATSTAGTTAVPATDTTLTTAPSGPAAYVSHGPRSANTVAFTFHVGGTTAHAIDMIAAITAAKVPVSTFWIGEFLDGHRDLAVQLHDGGHLVGNHTWSHPKLGALAPAPMRTEIARCRDLIAEVIGEPTPWFRPSGTDVPSAAILAAAGAAGYRHSIGYDVDPKDYTDPGAAAVLSRVRSTVRPGSIISLHFDHPATVTVFGKLVALVRTAGLEPVTLATLLG